MKTVGATLAALAALLAAVLAPYGAAQQGPSIGVDVDPSGNTATSLAAVDSCVSVKKGDTLEVDVFVTDVSNLLAWEAYFSFDGSVVEVTGRDVNLFLAAGPNSDVFDASESLPNSGGLYRLGAVDLGLPTSPDSGSGVLARLTLKAVGVGISPAALISLDANNDGKLDLGTRLKDSQEKPLGDANGDEFFDGTVANAQIAVNRECPPVTAETATPSPTGTSLTASPTAGTQGTAVATASGIATPAAPATPSPRASATTTAATTPTPGTPSSTDDGGTDWSSPIFVAVYVTAGVVAVLAVAGLALLGASRRRL